MRQSSQLVAALAEAKSVFVVQILNPNGGFLTDLRQKLKNDHGSSVHMAKFNIMCSAILQRVSEQSTTTADDGHDENVAMTGVEKAKLSKLSKLERRTNGLPESWKKVVVSLNDAKNMGAGALVMTQQPAATLLPVLQSLLGAKSSVAAKAKTKAPHTISMEEGEELLHYETGLPIPHERFSAIERISRNFKLDQGKIVAASKVVLSQEGQRLEKWQAEMLKEIGFTKELTGGAVLGWLEADQFHAGDKPIPRPHPGEGSKDKKSGDSGPIDISMGVEMNGDVLGE